MDAKLEIFTRLPSVAKVVVTHAYIRYRAFRESMIALTAARRSPPTDGGPRVVYITGFPRTGTTVLKY